MIVSSETLIKTEIVNKAIEFIRNLFITGNLVSDTFEGFWLGDPSFSGFALDFAVLGFLGFFTL